LKLWDADGSRYENRTTYDACRGFQTESVFVPEVRETSPGEAAGAAPRRVAIPSGTKLQIALRSRIDESTAYAGDAVEGELMKPVRDIPAGAIVKGRIVRLERHLRPQSYVALGIRFDSLEGKGVTAPLKLELITTSRAEKLLNDTAERRRGIGVFLFRVPRLNLNPGFPSEWRTTR
jgi:hypothetical protein